MSGEQSAPTGPDFEQGVLASEVLEGKPLLGHVQDQAAILTRSGGKLYAVGATCTHYSGPLAEGLVVDGTIRCPWHHAAFDLATGACTRPPALGAIPCWNVEERDGRAVVTGPRSTDAAAASSVNTAASPARPERAATTNTARVPSSIVVVGGGAAGAVAVATLREEGYVGPVTLVSAEKSGPVDRPNLSKDYLAGTAQEEWIPLRPDTWWSEQNVTLITDCAVKSLNTATRTLSLADGRTLEYGALLLATGAEPVRLDLGDGKTPVHYLRDWADSRAIIDRAATAKSAVVIGASFIALEVAASLRARGVEVTIVAPESQPLARVLGDELGAVVRELHESKGVTFRLGRTVRSADDTGVTLDDGSHIATAFIVAGVGVRPRVALAEAAGLAIDRGVRVNEFLETSAPGVYAAGDIARWPDARTGKPIRVEHWVLAERQGRVAARNLLGAKERFDAVPFFWSAHYDLVINYSGYAEKPDRIEVDGDARARDCTVRYFEGGRLAAVATIGRDLENLAAEAALERA